ncbi:hypothetical protein SOVF_069790 [Spinacia oleracea]|uniref:F-box/LRR-repeat protein At3g26922-like n=1 Tax=Spinacia oleracea TaxID=3562 RepID=A0A9R0K0I6_SPIOL|nr:F-box/LRR-repeat protein At3g26922-like [Spinacia oleracea]XP_056699516.1 F-box/LRR-repeat protein At3g26922-like [Spinacia oleracea]XP_056699517.1 F-box/LRR-repeat protein At3g26922-like [Spinacia oleracea]KNA18536.1 hypothetical protein SOVF_069790 [Spinacia oleracea]
MDEEDRLSSLPDSLLVEILSLLPLNNAAATSALSHRWVSLWTQLPRLKIDSDIPIFDLDSDSCKERFHESIATFNHILQHLTSPNIHTFDLHFHYPNLDIEQFNVCSASLISWIPLLCVRNPAILKVGSVILQNTGRHFITLPSCIFETHSIVNLDLCGFFYCKLPESGIVNLPNLKTLSFFAVDFDPKVLRTLFKSCPLLETLCLRLDLGEDQVLDISAPKLNFLTIGMTGPSYRSKIVIDAPLLEVMALIDCVALYSFVNIPPNLQKATIQFFDPEKVGVYLTSIPDLLQGISKAKSITFGNNLAVFNDLNPEDANVWSLFCNLTHLKLVLDKEYGDWGATIPSCLLNKLKSIELCAMNGDEDDVESVKYILGNANVLDKLHITPFANPRRYGRSVLWKEYKFCGDLFTLPRISVTCKIEFDGVYFRASSYGPQNESGCSEIDWLKSQTWPALNEDDDESDE